MMDKSAVYGVGLQFVLSVRGNQLHNQVTISTGRVNFRQRVLIETSENRQRWDVVRQNGVMFDVSAVDQHASGLSVSYPSSTRKFVRVTIEGWSDPTSLQSASISFLREVTAQRDLVADLRPTINENGRERTTNLNFDLGFARPYDRIEFRISSRLFSRETAVLTSADGRTWTSVGSGTLERSATQEHLTLEIPECWDRYVRAEVRNNDNAPLQFIGVRFEALRRQLIFPVEKPGLYWLYSGNPTAEQPRYDLANILPMSTAALETPVGQSRRNPDYLPPKPAAKKTATWLLTGPLILLVPTMGLIAFKMLRQVRSPMDIP